MHLCHTLNYHYSIALYLNYNVIAVSKIRRINGNEKKKYLIKINIMRFNDNRL